MIHISFVVIAVVPGLMLAVRSYQVKSKFMAMMGVRDLCPFLHLLRISRGGCNFALLCGGQGV